MKKKMGRPPKNQSELRTSRYAVMVDDATRGWLTRHTAATGASASEVIRQALAAYIETNPAPIAVKPARKRKTAKVESVEQPAEATKPETVDDF